MTTYSHNPNNHMSRRASMSATAPYTIPQKSKDHSNGLNGLPFSPPSNIHVPQHQQRPQDGHTSNGGTPQPGRTTASNGQGSQQQVSTSVPLLTREFVVRRISEGETGRLKEELKCEACGKGYKHISSLAKHLWEHTPEWNVTKKLLISKHQQVQLLEAASILVSMNDGAENDDQHEGQQKSSESQTNGPVFKNNANDQVKFNPTYNDHVSPKPILEEEEDEEDDESKMNVKLRTGSISQYPPSFNSTQNGSYLQHQRIPADRRMSHSFQSPSSLEHSGGVNGGFLDTPLKRRPNGMNSINGVITGDETKDSSESASPRDEDDDGTVFGQMD